MMAEKYSYHDRLTQCIEQIETVIVGKREMILMSLTSLLSGGHLLIEDVPGVGKTMLVRALAKTLGCDFSRIQFTPDLLPSDVLGVSIYQPKTETFNYMKGPVMSHIVLADEINRTSPKTQAALLEAMEEHSVTIDGKTMLIEEPFFVMATQNPVEYEGTYPLPEAQLDRFLMKVNMGYPNFDEELMLLSMNEKKQPVEQVTAILSQEDVLKIRKEVDDVYVSDIVKRYILELVRATRVAHQVALGVSPRGGINLLKATKAYAYLMGREYVTPDDVLALVPAVFCHRMLLTDDARYSDVTVEHVITDIISKVDIPIEADRL